jgi:hypothetical protein
MNLQRKRAANLIMTCLTQSPYDFVLAKLATKTVQYFGGYI